MGSFALVGALDHRYIEYMNSFPSLPEDTRRVASTLYGKGHIYLKLGDSLDELLVDLIPPEMKTWGTENKSSETFIQCAMLTVLQFVEELANLPMLGAVHSRVDLRYALHLPVSSPSLGPQDLCAFRKQLFFDPASLQIFQNLLDRLSEFGLFAPAKKPLDALQLLTTVCTVNRFDEVLEAMYRLLESLAVTNPEWLRQIAIPYWYDRYNRRRRHSPLPITDQKWHTRVLQIGTDIRYLLGEIDKSNNPNLASLEEIKEIRKIWDEQFIIITDEADHTQTYQWSPTRCASCSTQSVTQNHFNHHQLYSAGERS